jgi:hypothetical protein
MFTLKAKGRFYNQPGSGKLVDVNVIQHNPVILPHPRCRFVASVSALCQQNRLI